MCVHQNQTCPSKPDLSIKTRHVYPFDTALTPIPIRTCYTSNAHRGMENTTAVELCRVQCRKVISSDPSNEAATIILSETLFDSEAPGAAITPLEELLARAPNNYHALEKIIILLRRSGRLKEVHQQNQTCPEKQTYPSPFNKYTLLL